ncbi:hypothetical protein HYPSUDRAFT_219044 [Hypholoma sublateritium FD-334 SS-4]|uniref:Uncharacterized protein n=1 Tax=Hypholoma sublateritium (strain FD-334 SS-4) TaxID=945553 RepID=A0A0D2NKZ4_HYPSF|nr:hypothetical protein HYPSUDRAFT_219044 [Hypholoma sublateritium FD-334 SS-4]
MSHVPPQRILSPGEARAGALGAHFRDRSTSPATAPTRETHAVCIPRHVPEPRCTSHRTAAAPGHALHPQMHAAFLIITQPGHQAYAPPAGYPPRLPHMSGPMPALTLHRRTSHATVPNPPGRGATRPVRSALSLAAPLLTTIAKRRTTPRSTK